jgi:hypothetical protein
MRIQWAGQKNHNSQEAKGRLELAPRCQVQAQKNETIDLQKMK